jgi:hypothetical protein
MPALNVSSSPALTACAAGDTDRAAATMAAEKNEALMNTSLKSSARGLDGTCQCHAKCGAMDTLGTPAQGEGSLLS